MAYGMARLMARRVRREASVLALWLTWRVTHVANDIAAQQPSSACTQRHSSVMDGGLSRVCGGPHKPNDKAVPEFNSDGNRKVDGVVCDSENASGGSRMGAWVYCLGEDQVMTRPSLHSLSPPLPC